MQLGARWRVGETPHRSAPPALHGAIAAQESAHPGAQAWTITWLEGRPRCALDDLVVVTLDEDGSVAVRSLGPTGEGGPDPLPHEVEDDDWL